MINEMLCTGKEGKGKEWNAMQSNAMQCNGAQRYVMFCNVL